MIRTTRLIVVVVLIATGITVSAIIAPAVAGQPYPDAHQTGAIGLLVLLVVGFEWYAKACTIRDMFAPGY
jgi:hypothetical protein